LDEFIDYSYSKWITTNAIQSSSYEYDHCHGYGDDIFSWLWLDLGGKKTKNMIKVQSPAFLRAVF